MKRHTPGTAGPAVPHLGSGAGHYHRSREGHRPDHRPDHRHFGEHP